MKAKVIGVIFIGAGLFFFVFFSRTSTVACAHAGSDGVDCSVQIRWIGLAPLGSPQPIHNVQAAWVEHTCRAICDSYNCFYEVKLETAEGIISLSSDFFNATTADKTVGNISHFIASAEKTPLVITNIEWTMPLWGIGGVSVPLVTLGSLILAQAFKQSKPALCE